ncbi:MAG: hypothetical protein AAF810_06950 [Cyanobacteria bacterium P01_D01_bin.36]
MNKDVTVEGVIVPGHRVASGQATESPYPKGTIEMQTPHFRALGVDLSGFYPGTLNVSIAPHHFELFPSRTLHLVKWSPHHSAESFSFASVHLHWRQQSFEGLIYYPRPETKINHFQDPSVIELLMPFISGIMYDDAVILTARSGELKISESIIDK